MSRRSEKILLIIYALLFCFVCLNQMDSWKTSKKLDKIEQVIENKHTLKSDTVLIDGNRYIDGNIVNP